MFNSTYAPWSYSTVSSTVYLAGWRYESVATPVPKPTIVHVYACAACGNEWDPDLFRKGTCSSCGCGEKVLREIKKEGEE